MGQCVTYCRRRLGWAASCKFIADEEHVRIRLRERGADVRVFEGLDGDSVSGSGTVLAEIEVEQDAAYWEVRIVDLPEGGSFCVGVARTTIALQGALNAIPPGGLEADLIGQPSTSSASEAKKPTQQDAWALDSQDHTLGEGDVIGVGFGQGEFPNLRFFVNGELFGRASIKRVQGAVHPAFSISGGAVLSVVFDSDNFAHKPPAQFSELRASMSLLTG